MRASILVFGSFILACGGASEPAEAPSRPTAAPVGEAGSVPKGSLSRDAVVAMVDQGLGRFLQHVQVEPSLEASGFQGFRILALEPESFWRDVDLRVGDVVQGVNGQSIEQPNDAYQVFESLRVAPKLEVLLLRDGQAKQLVFPILGAPAPKAAAAPATAG